jgi:DNA-binding transcriptional LysR family regulator
MVHLVNLETFVYTAELGSFTAAAQALEIPKSTVARRVARLEAELGVALVQRTGRTLSLTDDGMALFEQCAVSLREIHSAKDMFVDSAAHPAGKLVIALPVDASASAGLIGLVTAFSLKAPSVQVELRATRVNQTGVDLLEDGSDVVFALSAGALDQGEPVDVDYVISRRLGRIPMGLVASPQYLEVHGMPSSISDLHTHRCLAIAAPFNTRWLLRDSADCEEVVPITAAIISNDPSALTALVLAGAGVAVMPYHASQPYVEQGLMRPVLERWSPHSLQLHLQWLRSRFLAPRVRAFVDHVQANLGHLPWLQTSGL